MAELGIGKIRGLTSLADASGTFRIVACDQRGAMRRMMEDSGVTPTYPRVVQAKLDIVGSLSPHATGALLDPEYGAAAVVAHRALAGTCGLVVAIEETGYALEAGERLSVLLGDWSVEKVKRMGASAAKLLVYYNPRRPVAAARQEALVESVAKTCLELDLPFMLEPIVYPTEPDAPLDEFLAEREDLIVESALALSRYDVDLYKVEFPHHPDLKGDKGDWLRSCEKLTAACRVPWALLSAGVDFTTYKGQLEAACRSGASGFVGGRAIWKEAVQLPPGSAREEFIRTEMVERFLRLSEIACSHGRPWYESDSHAYSPGAVADERWYTAY